MLDNLLFKIVFFCQIILISYYYPRKTLNKINYIFKTYPPSDYPKLYPQTPEYYEKTRYRFRVANLLILLAGLFLMGVILTDQTTDDYAGVVAGYFMIQFIPMMMLEISSFKYFKLMRKTDNRSTRKATLNPRGLFDFVSPLLVGLTAFFYIAFVAFVIVIQQYNFAWFGGYSNLVIITFGNLFFIAIILWNMFGKKRDPYLSHEDRMKQIGKVVKQLMVISIFMTLCVILVIMVRILEMPHLKQLVVSIYLQLITIVSFSTLNIENVDFEVYKGSDG